MITLVINADRNDDSKTTSEISKSLISSYSWSLHVGLISQEERKDLYG